MIGRACFSSIDKQLSNRVLARARQARNGADRLAFAEKVKDAGAFLSGQLVHEAKTPSLRAYVKHIGHFDLINQFCVAISILWCYQSVMRVVFADEKLALIETEEAGETGYR